MQRRINWGVSAGRTPYVLGYGYYTNTGTEYLIAHIGVDNANLFTQYPLSQTRRVELGTGFTRYNFMYETVSASYTGSGRTQTNRTRLDSPPSLNMYDASLAYVGDDATDGFTSPIAGTRYRLEVTPTVGSLAFQTLLGDVRRYIHAKPVTFAFRGLHYGRYGKDSDSEELGTLFLGQPGLVRGYDYNSFSSADCSPSGTGALAASSCPEFERLLGSRLAIASAELRIPLVGQSGYGIIQSSFPPIEIAPFVDAGVAWSGSSAASWRFDASSLDRTPVMSAGITSRINLFGAAIVEIYYARPYNRPGQTGGIWGFALQPGW
jgi:outer membrane protein assembly factor BamA